MEYKRKWREKKEKILCFVNIHFIKIYIEKAVRKGNMNMFRVAGTDKFSVTINIKNGRCGIISKHKLSDRT